MLTRELHTYLPTLRASFLRQFKLPLCHRFRVRRFRANRPPPSVTSYLCGSTLRFRCNAMTAIHAGKGKKQLSSEIISGLGRTSERIWSVSNRVVIIFESSASFLSPAEESATKLRASASSAIRNRKAGETGSRCNRHHRIFFFHRRRFTLSRTSIPFSPGYSSLGSRFACEAVEPLASSFSVFNLPPTISKRASRAFSVRRDLGLRRRKTLRGFITEGYDPGERFFDISRSEADPCGLVGLIWLEMRF